MNETTLKLFNNLSEEKQEEIIALMSKLLTYYRPIFSVRH